MTKVVHSKYDFDIENSIEHRINIINGHFEKEDKIDYSKEAILEVILKQNT